MANQGTGGEGGRWTRLAKALAGVAAFAGVGVVLLPGLAQRTPSPDRLPEAPRSGPDGSPGSFSAAEDHAFDPFAAGAVDPSPESGPRAFDCMIVPSEVVDVGSAITGVLAEVTVERGDYVDAGQVVARLEAGVEEAAVRVARARARRTDDLESSRTQLELSRKRLARAQELFDRDVLSLDTRQEVETKAELAALEVSRAEEDHRLAKLQLEQALANLERRTIRAPVAGVVTERLLSAGEVVDEETVVRIARVDPLRVEAILPAGWFGRTARGEPAEVVPEAPLDAARAAEVVIVDPVLDGASGTFGVQLDLPNPDRSLPAGLRCQVTFRGGPARPVAEVAPEAEPVETAEAAAEPEAKTAAEGAEAAVEAEAPAPDRSELGVREVPEVSAPKPSAEALEAVLPAEEVAAAEPAPAAPARSALPPSLWGYRWEPAPVPAPASPAGD